LSQNEKIPGQLVVVVSKFDAIQNLCRRKKLLDTPVIRKTDSGRSVLHVDSLQALSDDVRTILAEHAGEVINEAESSFQEVLYVPVSAFGRAPEQVNDQANLFGIRPRDVRSQWTEVPMLYALHKAAPRLVPVAQHKLSVVGAKDNEKQVRWKETG
jgi:hypothetical protein